MLLSRILVGFGSGNVAVMRTYGANASVKKDRAKAITMVTACWVRFVVFVRKMFSIQVCGITVGPAIQIAFAPIGYPGVKLFGALHLDMVNYILKIIYKIASGLLSSFLFSRSLVTHYAQNLAHREGVKWGN